MELKHLHSLVVARDAVAVETKTGVVGNVQSMRAFSAFLSYPRPDSPSYPADRDARTDRSGAKRGTARAVARAGRLGTWTGQPCRILAINPRGTIQSRWSRQLANLATLSRELRQPRMPSKVFGTAVA
jgi:hypothetical protein